MKVAVFKSPTGYTAAYSFDSGEAMIQYSHYTRIREYVEVDFPSLPVEVIVAGQIEQLDKVEQNLRNQFQQKLNELANERAKLLSLTHESAS